MKTTHKAIVLLTACIGIAACGRSLHADSPGLDGAIPRCAVLLSDARTEYRETAKRECDVLQASEARKTSGACEIAEHVRMCTEWQ